MEEITPSGDMYAPIDLEEFIEKRIRILLEFQNLDNYEIREGVLTSVHGGRGKFNSREANSLVILLEKTGKGIDINGSLFPVRRRQQREFPYKNIRKVYLVN